MHPHGFSVGLAVLSSVAAAVTIDYTADFPLGSEVENLALRPNGAAVVVVNTLPHIYEVQPAPNAAPRPIHTFHGFVGASSITATSTPDEFFIVTGNFSFQDLSPTPNSYAIHRLRFDCKGHATATELAPLHEMEQPNGMIHVPGTPFVLIADNRAGFVYRFNTATRVLDRYFDHPMLKPVPVNGIAFGVNGLKFSRGYLYFSNTNQQFIARIPATGTEFALQGTPEIVAKETPVDDFIVNDGTADVYITEQPDPNIGRLSFVSGGAYGTVPTTVAGGANSTAMLGPTAAAWAKGAVGKRLLVTVTGGFEQFVTQNYTGGGRIAIVHL